MEKALARRRARGRKSLTVSEKLMRNKILAFPKREFKTLLNMKKVSNKYVTLFGHLSNKDNNKLNISFVTKKK